MAKKPANNNGGISTTPDAITLSENAGLTPLGILAPSDTSYGAGKLTITVTALPTDGTIFLSDGVTAIYVGERLTVAQLTSLLFKPTSGLFNAKSNFTYTVTDPSGASATGTATLSIAPDTWPPVTNPASLTVVENAAPTFIGIVAPTDPNYSVSQLVIKITGLPADGVVLLSDGVTAVYNGQTLTVAQLTGLMFKPTTGLFGQSSSFTYTVTDPSGLSTTGTASLAIAADTAPPATTLTSLTVVGNSAATAIGIAAPTDANYSASQLSVKITGLPGDGIILLSDGATQVGLGTVLTVAQLTGLMFQAAAGVFNTSSTLTYAVTDPSGLSASGTATLGIRADTQPPITTDPTLTVTPNSGATPIGIPAPTDPNYAGTQLTATVTGLPSDGTVLLSDGVTQVTTGETLSVAQLTSLMFKPAGGLSGQTSNFTYTVIDPSGLSTPGLETLAISTTPPPTGGISPDGSTLMAGSSGSLITSAGTWTFSTIPTSYGYEILLNGNWAAAGSAVELEVANNGNLYAKNSSGQWWEWINSGWTQTANPSGGAPTTTTGIIDKSPTLLQPSQASDLVGVRLQNAGGSAEASGYVTFGQVFMPGAVKPTDSLVARINGVNYAVQMDVKSTNADGSVRQAILTLDAPAIAAGGTLDLMLAKGTSSAPSPAAPSASALLASGYNVGVSFTFHNSDGTTATDTASAAAALQAALGAGTVKTWLSGPGGNEYDVVTTVDGGKLKVEFDIRAYANGTTTTDVIFDNSWMFSPGKTDLNYDVSINQGGQQVYSASSIKQYLYSMWDHQVAGAGAVSPNIQYDVPYLINTGAIPAYDTSFGVSDAAIQYNYNGLNATSTGPMGTGTVGTYMPSTGGRQDIGPQPNWTSQWLLSQNATAYQVMMADANASGSIPWHYTDESTGKPINQQTYPNFTINEGTFGFLQPANGWPQYSNTGSPSADGDPWMPDNAHMPDLNYVPYLTTGSHYQLELLQAEADYAITSVFNGSTALDTSGTVPLGFADSFSGNGNIGSSNGNQTRAIAWELRTVAEAAYLTPDSDPLKAYFTNELNIAMRGLVQEYIVDDINGQYGQLRGFIEGSSGPNAGAMWPYGEDLVVTSLGEIAGMNIPQASAEAVQMLQYMNNFVAGLFTNGPNGFNPLDGTFYWIGVNDATGAPYTTWSQFFNANINPTWQQGNGGIPANPTELINWPTQTMGGYAAVAKAALADEITYTQSPQAIQAYGFVVSQMAYAFSLSGSDFSSGSGATLTAAYQNYPQWSIMPRLPDGTWLPNSQMQIDTSGASQVTLTATGGDSLLAVVGSGTATLNGGSGSSDLMFGGTGTTTFNPGPGNDYLFAAYNATGTQTFNDNTGSNYMYGSSAGHNIYAFVDNNSGHDTIANFNVTTDQVRIGANLNGNGITSAAQLIAGATVSNGNTILHLSSKDDITLLGVNQPSNLINSILVG